MLPREMLFKEIIVKEWFSSELINRSELWKEMQCTADTLYITEKLRVHQKKIYRTLPRAVRKVSIWTTVNTKLCGSIIFTYSEPKKVCTTEYRATGYLVDFVLVLDVSLMQDWKNWKIKIMWNAKIARQVESV